QTGVTWPRTPAGSNHWGASATWIAQRISPSGLVWAAPARGGAADLGWAAASSKGAHASDRDSRPTATGTNRAGLMVSLHAEGHGQVGARTIALPTVSVNGGKSS